VTRVGSHGRRFVSSALLGPCNQSNQDNRKTRCSEPKPSGRGPLCIAGRNLTPPFLTSDKQTPSFESSALSPRGHHLAENAQPTTRSTCPESMHSAPRPLMTTATLPRQQRRPATIQILRAGRRRSCHPGRLPRKSRYCKTTPLAAASTAGNQTIKL